MRRFTNRVYKAGCKTRQQFPAIGHPTRALQSSLQCSTADNTQSTHFHTLPEQCAEPQHAQHATDVRPEPPPLCDGTSPFHSNTHSNTMAHSFQLEFQSRVRSGRSRRCVINKRKRALHNSKRNVQMHGTDRRFHTRTVSQSRSPSYPRPFFTGQCLDSPKQTRRSSSSIFTNKAVARNPSRGQPAPKPVDVCGPSDPRTHVLMSRRRAWRSCRLLFPCCVLPCGRSSLDSVQRSRCL